MTKKIKRLAPFQYGVEIELYLPETNYDEFSEKMQDLGMEVKDDGSINPPYRDGIYYSTAEITTPPLHYKEMVELLTKVGEVCSKYKAKVNESCGLHVHTSNPGFFKRSNLRRIVGTWVSLEDVLFATQPKARLTNTYCKRKLREYATTDFPKLPEEKKALAYSLGNYDRYYALNLASMNAHGTIECRLHAGTIQATKIINWIKLLRSIYVYAMTKYEGREMHKLFNQPISEKKIKATWDILGIEAETRAHFNRRISKLLFPELAKQQKIAKNVMKLRGKSSKMFREFQKKDEEARALRVSYDQVRIQQDEMLRDFGQGQQSRY